MIGNDVVDLDLVQNESNWKRNGYLDKIFTKSEQLLISNDSNPGDMVWNLWSRKEAAYKIYNRKTGIRGYFPLQLECFNLWSTPEFVYGKVLIHEVLFYTQTKSTNQYIHSIAVEKWDDFSIVFYLKNRNSIQKTNGIPNFCENKKNKLKPVSISHHGKFEQIVMLNSDSI